MLVVAGIQGAIAYMVKPIINYVFVNKDPTYLLLFALGLPILEFVKVAFRTIQNYVMQYCGLRVIEQLRDELFRKIVYLPMRYYEKAQVGMLMRDRKSVV